MRFEAPEPANDNEKIWLPEIRSVFEKAPEDAQEAVLYGFGTDTSEEMFALVKVAILRDPALAKEIYWKMSDIEEKNEVDTDPVERERRLQAIGESLRADVEALDQDN
jgi:hypothetical protein